MSHKPSAISSGFSLRVRLTLWYGTALAVILLTFATVLYVEMDRELKDQVDGSLEEAAKAAVHSLEQHRFGPFLQYEDLSAQFPELAVLDKFFQIFSPTGKITIQSPHIKNRDIPLSRTALETALAGNTTLESVLFRGDSPLRLISVPHIYEGTHTNIVQDGPSLQPRQQSLQRPLIIRL